MTKSTEKLVYTSTERDSLALVLQLANDRIKAQMELARGADTRAQGIVTVCAGFASFAVTGVLTAKYNNLTEVLTPLSVAAVIWVIGAFIGAYSFRPVLITAPGWEPNDLHEDLGANKKYCELVCEMLPHLDEGISENHKIMSTNARLTRIAMATVIIAPLAALVAFFVQ